jgi:hypothetical protein
MPRQIRDRCASCGISFVIGTFFADYIAYLKQRGLRRTLNFDYNLYGSMFGHGGGANWPTDVTVADCDSIFVGSPVDTEMRCPKCGEFAFAEEEV